MPLLHEGIIGAVKLCVCGLAFYPQSVQGLLVHLRPPKYVTRIRTTVSVLSMLTACSIFIAIIISDMYVDTAYRGDIKAPTVTVR